MDEKMDLAKIDPHVVGVIGPDGQRLVLSGHAGRHHWGLDANHMRVFVNKAGANRIECKKVAVRLSELGEWLDGQG